MSIEFERIQSVLLAFGGDRLITVPESVPVDGFMESAFLMHGPITFQEMQPRHCHLNIARAWLSAPMRNRGLVGICTGYALADDGAWREHWWGLLRNGILETTENRTVYVGILIQDQAADDLAHAVIEKIEKGRDLSIDP